MSNSSYLCLNGRKVERITSQRGGGDHGTVSHSSLDDGYIRTFAAIANTLEQAEYPYHTKSVNRVQDWTQQKISFGLIDLLDLLPHPDICLIDSDPPSHISFGKSFN